MFGARRGSGRLTGCPWRVGGLCEGVAGIVGAVVVQQSRVTWLIVVSYNIRISRCGDGVALEVG